MRTPRKDKLRSRSPPPHRVMTTREPALARFACRGESGDGLGREGFGYDRPSPKTVGLPPSFGGGRSSIETRGFNPELQMSSLINEVLPHRNSPSIRFQWNQLMREKGVNSDGKDANPNVCKQFCSNYGDGGVETTRISAEREYPGNRYSDSGRWSNDTFVPKAMYMGNERAGGRGHLSYHPDSGIGRDCSMQLNERLQSPIEYPNAGTHVHDDEELAIRETLRECESRNMELHKNYHRAPMISKDNSHHPMPHSHYAPGSLGITQSRFPGIHRDDPRTDSVGIIMGPGMVQEFIARDGHAHLTSDSSINPGRQVKDVIKHRTHFREITRDYSYPEVQQTERRELGTLTDEICGKLENVQNDYGHQERSRARIVDPTFGRANDSQRFNGDHLRFTRVSGGHCSVPEGPAPNYLHVNDEQESLNCRYISSASHSFVRGADVRDSRITKRQFQTERCQGQKSLNKTERNQDHVGLCETQAYGDHEDLHQIHFYRDQKEQCETKDYGDHEGLHQTHYYRDHKNLCETQIYSDHEDLHLTQLYREQKDPCETQIYGDNGDLYQTQLYGDHMDPHETHIYSDHEDLQRKTHIFSDHDELHQAKFYGDLKDHRQTQTYGNHETQYIDHNSIQEKQIYGGHEDLGESQIYGDRHVLHEQQTYHEDLRETKIHGDCKVLHEQQSDRDHENLQKTQAYQDHRGLHEAQTYGDHRHFRGKQFYRHDDLYEKQDPDHKVLHEAQSYRDHRDMHEIHTYHDDRHLHEKHVHGHQHETKSYQGRESSRMEKQDSDHEVLHEAQSYRDHRRLHETHAHHDDRHLHEKHVHEHRHETKSYQGRESSRMVQGFCAGGTDTSWSYNGHLGKSGCNPSESMLKRKHGADKKINGQKSRGQLMSPVNVSDNYDLTNINEQLKVEDMDNVHLPSNLWHCQAGKDVRISREITSHETYKSDDWLSNSNLPMTLRTRLSKSHISAGRDIRKRLKPGPTIMLNTSLGKKQSVMFEKRRHDSSCGSSDARVGNPAESTDISANISLSEDSEDFKQLVNSSFFKFVKQLYENPVCARKYMEQGKTGGLKCSICNSNSLFMGTKSLAMHAFNSLKVGLRTQHLGFYKALCLLLGWDSTRPPNSPKAALVLPKSNFLALKEDLVIWPPVVIIHNNSVGNNDPGKRMVLTVEALVTILRDKGFGGERIKVCCGKPENHSIMVVKFKGTFSGLQEAEKLHKLYAETKHGRLEFQLTNSDSGNISNVQNPVRDKVEDVLYGYLGIAEDLDKLDFESKKRSLVKSKKEIQAIADASLKTE